MITKFVLIVWLGFNHSQMLSTQSFDTLAECEAVAVVLETEMDEYGLYICKPYTFDGDAKE
jgi:hypothetical protein